MRPIISVVIPCFNSAVLLPQTLTSLCEQTEKRFEVVVVDDCSSDDSVAVCQKMLSQLNYQTVELVENVGPGEARNCGIEAAKADLIAFIDSDDLWEPNKLEEQLALHIASGCAVSCTGYRIGGNRVIENKVDYISLLKNNVINTSSVMFDRSKVSLRFESEYLDEDYIAWLDVAKKAEIRFLDKVLVTRRNFDGLSANKFKMAIKRWRVYRDFERLSLPRSSYYFLHYAMTGLVKYLKQFS